MEHILFGILAEARLHVEDTPASVLGSRVDADASANRSSNIFRMSACLRSIEGAVVARMGLSAASSASEYLRNMVYIDVLQGLQEVGYVVRFKNAI